MDDTLNMAAAVMMIAGAMIIDVIQNTVMESDCMNAAVVEDEMNIKDEAGSAAMTFVIIEAMKKIETDDTEVIVSMIVATVLTTTMGRLHHT